MSKEIGERCESSRSLRFSINRPCLFVFVCFPLFLLHLDRGLYFTHTRKAEGRKEGGVGRTQLNIIAPTDR